MSFVIRLLATGFGVGNSRLAPGTLGTLWGIPLAWVFSRLGHTLFFLSALAFGIFAVWVASQAMSFYQADAKAHDPRQIVIDEVVGMIFALAFWKLSWPVIVGAFLFFRFFDVVKPFPIKWVEKKFSGGPGIVLDDVAAGICANFCLQLIHFVR